MNISHSKPDLTNLKISAEVPNWAVMKKAFRRNKTALEEVCREIWLTWEADKRSGGEVMGKVRWWEGLHTLSNCSFHQTPDRSYEIFESKQVRQTTQGRLQNEHSA